MSSPSARTPISNTQVIYVGPPADGASPDPGTTFELVEEQPTGVDTDLQEGEVLVRNHLLSVDPYHRFGLYDPTKTSSQFPATPVGAVLGTLGTGEIISSKDDKFPVGGAVAGWLRWEQISRVSATDTQFLQLIDDGVDPAWYLGPLGTPGLTGYAGLTQVAKPQPGETAVVSAIGGAVGSVAAQTAKHMGLRVVGTAGSPAKATALQERYDLDAVIDHRQSGELEGALKQACPDGIDVYLDLVGGELLDAVIANMNIGGRIAVAGMVSQYNLASSERYGLRNLDRIVGMDITIQSYDNGAYKHLLPELRSAFTPRLRAGSMVFEPHISTGIETLPQALDDIFSGNAKGTRLVDVR